MVRVHQYAITMLSKKTNLLTTGTPENINNPASTKMDAKMNRNDSINPASTVLDAKSIGNHYLDLPAAGKEAKKKRNDFVDLTTEDMQAKNNRNESIDVPADQMETKKNRNIFLEPPMDETKRNDRTDLPASQMETKNNQNGCIEPPMDETKRNDCIDLPESQMETNNNRNDFSCLKTTTWSDLAIGGLLATGAIAANAMIWTATELIGIVNKKNECCSELKTALIDANQSVQLDLSSEVEFMSSNTSTTSSISKDNSSTMISLTNGSARLKRLQTTDGLEMHQNKRVRVQNETVAIYNWTQMKEIIDRNPTFHELCIENEVIVYEVFAFGSDNKVDEQRKLSPRRLAKSKAIHLVRNHDTIGAKTLVMSKHAEYKHYSYNLGAALVALESMEYPGKIGVHLPGAFFEDDFILVDSNTSMDSIDLEDVSNLFRQRDLKESIPRQHRFIDLGYCSLVSQERNGTGISTPRLHPESKEPGAVEILTALSKTVMQYRPKFLDGKKVFDDTHRNDSFAKKIGRENVIEYSRVADMWHANPRSINPQRRRTNVLAIHDDSRENSKHRQYQVNITVSCILCDDHGKYRRCITATGRKSIDSAMVRSMVHEPFARCVIGAMEEMGIHRRNLSQEAVKEIGTKVSLAGMTIISAPCHLKVSAYLGCMIEGCSMPFSILGGNLLGMIGLQRAYLTAPHVGFVFMEAVRRVTCLVKLKLDGWEKCSLYQFSFGFRVQQEMGKIYGSLPSEIGRYFRFNWYRHPRFFSLYKEYKWQCRRLFNGQLAVTKCFPNLRTEPGRREYPKIRAFLESLMPSGIGSLISSNFIAGASAIGTLPKWIRNHCEINPSSRSVEWFDRKFHLNLTKNGVRARVIRDIVSTLGEYMEEAVTDRDLENIICKVYRYLNRNDDKFSDTYLEEMHIYDIKSDGIEVHPPDVESGTTWLQSIVSRWPCYGDMLTLEEIVEELKWETKSLPSKEFCANETIPSGLKTKKVNAILEMSYEGKWQWMRRKSSGDEMEITTEGT